MDDSAFDALTRSLSASRRGLFGAVLAVLGLDAAGAKKRGKRKKKKKPSCTPNCTGKNCGDNGCGGSCGTCESGFPCIDGWCDGCPPDMHRCNQWLCCYDHHMCSTNFPNGCGYCPRGSHECTAPQGQCCANGLVCTNDTCGACPATDYCSLTTSCGFTGGRSDPTGIDCFCVTSVDEITTCTSGEGGNCVSNCTDDAQCETELGVPAVCIDTGCRGEERTCCLVKGCVVYHCVVDNDCTSSGYKCIDEICQCVDPSCQ